MLVVLILAGILCGCQLSDKGTKAAVINTRDVLTKCNDGLRAVEEVQRQFADRQAQLKAQEEAMQQLRQNPTLNEPKSGKKRELQSLTQKFIEDSQKLRKDVGDVEAVKFKPIVDKINKVLATYAKEHGFVSVQDKNGFAYIDPSIDITDAIIKLVDQVK
jgi:outer membrane protein